MMTITTRSGSKYQFSTRDNQVYFKKGHIEGIVLKISGLSLGEHLKVDFFPIKNNVQSDDLNFIESTTIISIE